jgi:hypothetical protein
MGVSLLARYVKTGRREEVCMGCAVRSSWRDTRVLVTGIHWQSRYNHLRAICGYCLLINVDWVVLMNEMKMVEYGLISSLE